MLCSPLSLNRLRHLSKPESPACSISTGRGSTCKVLVYSKWQFQTTGKVWDIELIRPFLPAAFLFASFNFASLWAQVGTPRNVQWVEPGTVVGQSTTTGWNRAVMLSKPRIASGDVDSLPGFIQTSVPKFMLTVLAKVDQALPGVNGKGAANNGPPKYRLAEVGIGYSILVGKQWIVVRSDNYDFTGVSLSLLERQLLSQNYRHLEDIRTVGRASTVMIFDAVANLLQSNQHREFHMRHLVWIDGQTGKLATIVWLVNADETRGLSVFGEQAPRWIDNDAIEDRAIHIDKTQFTLGIPSPLAFAMEKMPPGREIPWTADLLPLAALDQYRLDDIRELMSAFNRANQNAGK
jgi:hypothetical protein